MSTFIPRALPSRALRNPVYEEANTPSAAETRIQAALKPIEPIEPIRAIPIDFPDTALIGSELGGETSLLEARQVQKPLFSPEPRIEPSDFNFGKDTEQAKRFLEEKLGKSIVVKNVNSSYPAEVAGFYLPGAFSGGSSDQVKRNIYLRPNSSYATLFHEVGHAADPSLLDLNARERSFNPAVIRRYTQPEERLGYLFENQSKPRIKAEAEAQSFMMRNLPSFGRANPGIGINYSDTANHPWFKEYPASYGPAAIDNFYRAELGSRKQMVTGEDSDQGVATRVFSPSDSAALDFALNKDLRAKEDEILNWTRNYVNTRLDRFQDQPTPNAADYWAPRNY